ncbi:hypothetical protein TL16_g06701 [Triparma laevis f. inornata]|uniref:IPT/TIG domain-containing protein n=1 Tax=Triparma laevis f. inornata TaxID=1714386 RepID=A0A9W7AUC2_9STRA|nr:hypothetical protein TL16_g06701 [Triparma laevis f. inornata]
MTISGLDFDDASANVKVKFTMADDASAVVVTAPITVTATSVEVTVPACGSGASGGYSTVEVSVNNGVQYTSNMVPFLYESAPAITSVKPSTVPELSNTVVTITGVSFKRSKPSLLSCKIGSEVVPGTWISDSSVTCFVPETLKSNHYSVYLTTNGKDYFSDAQAKTSLYLRPAIEVKEIFPLHGPSNGGTLVTVTGRGFDPSESLVCSFNGNIVAANYVNGTAVTCTTPSQRVLVTETDSADYKEPVAPFKLVLSSLAAGSIASTTGDIEGVSSSTLSDKLDVGLHFTYYDAELVTTLTPQLAPSRGGTLLKVSGAFYQDTPELSCDVGGVIVPATFKTASEVWCTAPASAAEFSQSSRLSQVSVSVSNNGVDFSASNVAQFFYYQEAELAGLSPSAGPELGGTTVRVYASSELFIEQPHLVGSDLTLFKCKFAETEVTAKFLSPDSVECVAPPAGIAKAVSVSVTLNGLDYTQSTTTYTYKNVPTVSELQPAEGVVGGGNIVSVVGSNFDDSGAAVFCKFGPVVVPATVASSQLLTCKSPNHVAGPVAVEVTNHQNASETSAENVQSTSYVNDSAQWTTDNLVFTYVRPVTVDAVVPRHMSAAGGTSVTLVGEDFPDISSLCCFFGSSSGVTVPATYVNTKSVECTSPALASEVGVVPIGLGTCASHVGHTHTDSDSADFSGYLHPNLAQITLTASPSVTSVFPARGIKTGLTLVTVSGEDFIDNKADSSIFCRFGSVGQTVGKYISPQAVECETPTTGSVTIAELREVQEIAVVGSSKVKEVQKISFTGTPINEEVQRLKFFAWGDDAGSGAVAQKVRVLGKASSSLSGQFRLAIGGVNTAWLSIYATGAEVEAEVERVLFDDVSLAKLTPLVDYTLSDGDDSFAYDITLLSVPGGLSSIGAFTCDSTQMSALYHDDVSCDIAEVISATSTVLDGTINIDYSGTSSSSAVDISTISATNVETVINSIAGIEAVTVTVDPDAAAMGHSNGYTYLVTFNFAEDIDMLDFGFSSDSLTGTDAKATTAETVKGSFVDGTLDLTFAGQTAVGISVSASEGDIVTAVESFTYIVPGSVTVTRSTDSVMNAYQWLVTFSAMDGGLNNLSADVTNLRGNADIGMDFSEEQEGRDVLGGTYRIGFDGEWAESALGFNATGQEVEAALESLSTVGFITVSASVGHGLHGYSKLINSGANKTLTGPDSHFGSVYQVTFTTFGTPSNTGSIPLISSNFDLLTGTDAQVLVTRTNPSCCDIELSFNGQDYFGSNAARVPFTYDERAVVTAVTPDHGQVTGDTLVTLTGSGIPSVDPSFGESLLCVFGSLETEATWISESSVTCRTPRHAKSKVVVSLRQNSENATSSIVSSSSATFDFVQKPEVASFAPRYLAVTNKEFDQALFADTKIKVFGSNFLATADLKCVFEYSVEASSAAGGRLNGSTFTSATTYFNSSYIECDSVPALDEFYSSSGTSTWHYNADLNKNAQVSMSLTKNAKDYTDPQHFVYIPVHTVSSISPKLGTNAGGTVVTVTGSNFQEPNLNDAAVFNTSTSTLLCKFGDEPTSIVTATYVSSTKILCASPKHFTVVGGNEVDLEVSVNGQELTNQGLKFLYIEETVVEKISPAFGPSTGGTVVTLKLDDNEMALRTIAINQEYDLQYGAWITRGVPVAADQVRDAYESELDAAGTVNFDFSDALTATYMDVLCKFNNSFVVAASVFDSSTVTCVSPAASAVGGLVTVELSVNGGSDWTQDEVIFSYSAGQKVEAVSISPTHGPRTGGTMVNVTGLSGFQSAITKSGSVKCRFGTTEGLASQVADDGSWVTCVSPASASGGTFVGTVSVDVSLNGASEDFTSSSTLFNYEDILHLARIEPSWGPVAGSTHVQVVGGKFNNYSSELLCRFGDTVVDAEFVDENRIDCPSPYLGSIDEVQTVSVFSMAWAPEIQSIMADASDYYPETHTVMTRANVGTPQGEIQTLQFTADDVDEVQTVTTGVDITGDIKLRVDLDVQAQIDEVQTLVTSVSPVNQKQRFVISTFGDGGEAAGNEGEMLTLTAVSTDLGNNVGSFDIGFGGSTSNFAVATVSETIVINQFNSDLGLTVSSTSVSDNGNTRVWTITYDGSLGDIAEVTLSNDSGLSSAPVASTERQGSVQEGITVTVTNSNTGVNSEYWQLSLDSGTTWSSELKHDSTADQVEAAILEFNPLYPTMIGDSVKVTFVSDGVSSDVYKVTFLNSVGDVPAMSFQHTFSSVGSGVAAAVDETGTSYSLSGTFRLGYNGGFSSAFDVATATGSAIESDLVASFAGISAVIVRFDTIYSPAFIVMDVTVLAPTVPAHEFVFDDVSLAGTRKDVSTETLSSANVLSGGFRLYTGNWNGGTNANVSPMLDHDISNTDLATAIVNLNSSWTGASVAKTALDTDFKTNSWAIDFPAGSGNVDLLQIMHSFRGEGASIDIQETARGSVVEIQTVKITGTSNIEGNYTLELDSHRTLPIDWNASATEVRDALMAIESVGVVKVLRVETNSSRSNGWFSESQDDDVVENSVMPIDEFKTYEYRITFVSHVGDVSPLTACCDENNLQFRPDGTQRPVTIFSTFSEDAEVVVEEMRKGTGHKMSGYWKITLDAAEYDSYTTIPLLVGASAQEVEDAIAELPVVQAKGNGVSVTHSYSAFENGAGSYDVTLSGFQDAANATATESRVPMNVTVDTSLVKGNGATIVPTLTTDFSKKEIQKIDATATASGATITCTDGVNSFAFAATSTAVVVATQIETTVDGNGLPAFGEVEVSKVPASPHTWIITFAEVATVATLSCDNSASVNLEQAGTSAPITTGGFKLTYGGFETSTIAYNAAHGTVQSELEGLASIGAGNVAVTANNGGNADMNGGYSWDVTFTGATVEGNVAMLGASDNTLDGTNSFVRFSEKVLGNEVGGSFRVKLPLARTSSSDAEWSPYIPVDAPYKTVKYLLESMNFIDEVLVSKSSKDAQKGSTYTISFSHYVGNEPTGFIPKTARNLDEIIVDKSQLTGVNADAAVGTIQDGTDPVSVEYNRKGFRIVNPGGSRAYPMSKRTRWLKPDETAESMKAALVDATGLPVGFSVDRVGPYEDGGFEWTVTLAKGDTLAGDTLWVVASGGAKVHLYPDSGTVECTIKRMASFPITGDFALQFNGLTAGPLQHDASAEEVRTALLGLANDEIGDLIVSEHSVDYHNSGSNAKRWDVTFSSLKEAGDVPAIVPVANFATGTNANLTVTEQRKGTSSVVQKIAVENTATNGALDDTTGFIIGFNSTKLFGGSDAFYLTAELPLGASAADVQAELANVHRQATTSTAHSSGGVVVEKFNFADRDEYYVLFTNNNRDEQGWEYGHDRVGNIDELFIVKKKVYCDNTQSTICDDDITQGSIHAGYTASRLGGTFSLGYGEDCFEKFKAKYAKEQYEVICSAARTAELPFNATAVEVEAALEALPAIVDVTVTRTHDENDLQDHKIPVKSGVVSSNYNYHIHFKEVYLNMTSDISEFYFQDKYKAVDNSFEGDEMDNKDEFLWSGGDIPPLTTFGGNLEGTPTRDHALLKSYNIKSFEVVKGVNVDVGGKVAVEVSQNGQDFTASSAADSTLIFQYLPVARVNGLQPNHGPSSAIICLSPPFLKKRGDGDDARSVYVEVSNNGAGGFANFSESSTMAYNIYSKKTLFTYDEPAFVQDFFPRSGPLSGNFSVNVFGGPFVDTDELRCRFGEKTVIGKYLDSGAMQCYAPKFTFAGGYALEVSLNDQDYTQQRLTFDYYEDVRLSRVYPVSGPATTAGTQVRVYGNGFRNVSTNLCRFGLTEVPAEYVSDHEVVCDTPVLHPDSGGLRYLALSEQYNRYPDPAHGSRRLFPTAHHYPLYNSRLVAVEVTNNAQDYSDSGITFLYQDDTLVTNLSGSGPYNGGTPLFVSGKNFVNSTSLVCRIGHSVVDAVFITRDGLLCFTPPQPFFESEHGYSSHGNIRDDANFPHAVDYKIRPDGSPPNEVYVEVSNNGEDFTTNRKVFKYEENVKKGTYNPGDDNLSQLECPRGAFCPDTGAKNFTMCPRGTYQPLKNQDSCLRCPIGYMCPEQGLHVPRICPSGFVCDVTGIEIAEQPCPEGHFCLQGTATTATTCGHPFVSSELFPSLTQAERTSTIRKGREPEGFDLLLGARNAACWNNNTADFGIQVSDMPARVWAERHLLPFSDDTAFEPTRGRFCLDDSCVKLEDAEDMSVADVSFDYSSQAFALRRPVPCPAGMYCHPGTAVNISNINDYTTPQPCSESMYCPEGSADPLGAGECPRGFYCPFAKKIPCPVGTYCPRDGHWDPLPCPPGFFNAMTGQIKCTACPRGFICPSFGRLMPAICPPGYSCSRGQLTSPNAMCPAGFFCPNGTITSDPFRNDTTLRPYPCSPGSYCLGGVGSDEVRLGDFAYAQPCTEGFYCELASVDPKGSGLCPAGFLCPAGTSNPIPTPKGYFAASKGTVQAAACLPGYYAPTVQTKECYPCPPGTTCEVDGLFEAEICPPGTYRSTLTEDGLPCASCPQGTWSKNWQMREKGECTRCPTGVVCPVEGMTQPCGRDDLPKPFEPVVNLNGLPVPEYEYPNYDVPPSFSLFECLKQNTGYTERTMDPYYQEFFFGELVPPYIDVLGRGAHFRSSSSYSLLYQQKTGLPAKCYRNNMRFGSILYQRISDYYGPQYDIQTGYSHQGYGSASKFNKVYTQSPPTKGYDPTLRYFHGEGTVYIDLPHARIFEPTYNCTTGIKLLDEMLNPRIDNIVYTSAEHDEGGYDLIKCPVFDEELACFTDPSFELHAEGECCFIPGGQQRAIGMADDEFYPGTCESDKICVDDLAAEAESCSEGYVCDEMTTTAMKNDHVCREGYYCDFGTTPDPNLEAPRGQFSNLCPAGHYCNDGTGLGQAYRFLCPEGFFCPTGTGNPFLGAVADDAQNRQLGVSIANPYTDKVHLKYLADDEVRLIGDHERRCFNGIDVDFKRRFEKSWRDIGQNMTNSHLSYLRDLKDNNPLYNGTSFIPPYNLDDENGEELGKPDGPYRQYVVNKAIQNDLTCARDNKWKLVGDTIERRECDCLNQIYIIAAVYRLWQCTADEALEDLGMGSVSRVNLGTGVTDKNDANFNGGRDFWFDRYHLDKSFALEMDHTLEGYGLKWLKDDGINICEWDDNGDFQLDEGRIPRFDSTGAHDDGNWYDPPLKEIFPPGEDNFVYEGGKVKMKHVGNNTNFGIRFTWNEYKHFSSYKELKAEVHAEYVHEIDEINFKSGRSRMSLDPYIFDLNYALRMVEEFGTLLPDMVFFREKTVSDHPLTAQKVSKPGAVDSFVSKDDFVDNGDNVLSFVPGRLDTCDCQNIYKCPNGTKSSVKSDGIEDCAVPENPEVLRRISVIPNWYWMDLNSTYGEYVSERYKLFQDYKVHGQDTDANNNPNKVVRNKRKYVNTTDFNDVGNMEKSGDSIGTLKLETNEVAIFTMNLTGLPNNMTYEEHYRISLYVDCKPCPNRYQCLYNEDPKGKCDNPDSGVQ